jgi:hypothetical protein
MRRFGVADLLLLLLVLAIAAGARVGYVWYAADGGKTNGPLAVQDEALAPGEAYHLAQSLKENNLFMAKAPFASDVELTAHTAPGYPYLLALTAYAAEASQRDVLVRWIQVGLGTLTAGLYFLFARRAFHSLLVGTLAGLFCALHPFWVFNTPAIDDGVLASFGLGLCLWLGARAAQTGGALSSLLFGLGLAGLALVRAALLPFAFLSVGWFLLRTRRADRGWLCALVAFLGFAGGLAPWTVRNWQVFEEPVPVVDSAHYHLWVGNNPDATGGPVTEAALKAASAKDLAKVTKQTDRYAKLGSLWWEEVQAHPVETVRRRIWAGLFFVFGEKWFTGNQLTEDISTADQPMPEWLGTSYVQLLQGSLLGMLLLSFLGWRWSYGWRYESMPAALAMVWVSLPYLISHAEGLSGPRLPLDGVLLTYAAFALACCIPGIGRDLLDGARRDDRSAEDYR